MKLKCLLPLLLPVLALMVSGCHWQFWKPEVTMPVVFQAPPSLEQLTSHLAANRQAVRQLQANGASLTLPGSGMPSLSVNLSMQPDRNLRFVGSTGLTGTELDLGSNDNLFWFWIKRNEPPAVFYARHGEFHNSAARQVFPVEPDWLIEALGLAFLDPNDQHTGPYPRANNLLEIRTVRQQPSGPQTRVLIIDSQRGYVVEQHLYDSSGELLASALASDHRQDPVTNAVLPHTVELVLAPAQLRMKLQVHHYQINQSMGNPAQLYALPQLSDHQYVDLADPRLQVNSPGATTPLPTAPVPGRLPLQPPSAEGRPVDLGPFRQSQLGPSRWGGSASPLYRAQSPAPPVIPRRPLR